MRRQALAHQVETASPWVRTDQYVVWRDGVAQVWFWDQARVEKILADTSVSGLAHLRLKTAIRLPETVFAPMQVSNGVVVQSCGNGWEILRWDKRLVRASRWYPERPLGPNVAWFLRSQGLDADSSVDFLSLTQDRLAPWPGVRPSPWQWLQLHRQSASYVVVAIMILITSLQLTAGARWWWLERNYREQASALQESADELLRARGSARREVVRYTQLLALFDVPGALASQWLVASRMPAGLEFKVVVWERVGRDVEVVIAAEVGDTLSVVRALTGPGIDSVSVEPWRKAGHYSVKLRLTGAIESQSGEGGNVLAK